MDDTNRTPGFDPSELIGWPAGRAAERIRDEGFRV